MRVYYEDIKIYSTVERNKNYEGKCIFCDIEKLKVTVLVQFKKIYKYIQHLNHI